MLYAKLGRNYIYVYEPRSQSDHLISSNDEFWVSQIYGHETTRQSQKQIFYYVNKTFLVIYS